MAGRVRARPGFAFDGPSMERFWTLENDFLAALGRTERDLSVRRNQLLLSAVLFGGLLDAETWPDWIRSVMGHLRSLAPGEKLDARLTQAVFISGKGRNWFADPITQNLLSRQVATKSRDAIGPGISQGSDYTRIIQLEETALTTELGNWVLPAAKIKMALLWPPVVVEHCVGSLRSASLSRDGWSELNKSDVKSRRRTLVPDELRRPESPKPTKGRKHYWFEDKLFHFIRMAIEKAIDSYANSADPTLAHERTELTRAITDSLGENMSYRYEDKDHHQNNIGWWLYKWFLEHCPERPLQKNQKPKYKRASTLLDHAYTLGLSVSWSDIWDQPRIYTTPDQIETILHSILAERPDGFVVAKRFFSYLGFGNLSRPEGLQTQHRVVNVKRQILSWPQFQALLSQLEHGTGRRGTHWLAAVLMFRCGLRPREVVALEIDHIVIADEIVELTVAATPYVSLKNKTSGRVLPLHALLSTDELAELLKWRSLRIRDCASERKNARLLFDTVYHPSDYPYLCDRIETAIRAVSRQPQATTDERKTAAYIFSRCSILRHSFVSYAVATMLFPRDAHEFRLPAGITSDLVSLARRERLEHALLSEGHLGLSSLEAVRQLTGHSRFQRTIGTYTHLMDLVAAAYCWRQSCEPSLPAEVLCQLAPDKPKAETLSHYARKESLKEQSAIATAVDALQNEQEVINLVLPRARRPRGKTFPGWMPQGNAFLSQLRSKSHPDAKERLVAIPEWRRDEVADYYSLNQIVQMASRGVPARLIADELGIRLVHVERLARRFHQLLSLKRRTTARGIGLPRHGLILEKRDAVIGDFDAENSCWYQPLKQPSSFHQSGLSQFWNKLQNLRQQPTELAMIRTFLRKHQDGAIHIKNVKYEVARKLRAPPPQVKTEGLGSFQRGRPGHDRTKIRSERKQKAKRKRAIWPTNAMLVHLLLLAEAAASDDMPDILVKVPATGLGIDVSGKIAAYRIAQDRKAQETQAEKLKLEREAQEAQRVNKAKVNETRRLTRKKNWEKQSRGEQLCEVEIMYPRRKWRKPSRQ